jgi:7 transmembrane sweet-taste receptor of 3 GCPR/Receptor family ligand binding region
VNIVTESIAFSRQITKPEAESVFESLKRLQYYHVYAICYPEQLELLLSVGFELNVIGPEYLYIFPGVDVYSLQQNFRIADGKNHGFLFFYLLTPQSYITLLITPKGSSFSKAIQGIGLIQISGGVTIDHVTQGKEATPIFNENPITGYDRFRLSWRNSLQDTEFQTYVRSKLPNSIAEINNLTIDDFFVQEPIGVHAFLYDAVTAFGVSMCRTNSSQFFFTGQDIYSYLRELDIESASGTVRMTSTGTRNISTVAFALWNVRVVGVDSDGMSIVEFVPSYSYIAEKWEVLSGNEFIFANGSSIPPESLPPINHDNNYILRADRAFGYTLMGLSITSSIIAIVWTIIYRKNHVIDSAQPLFLLIVFVGALIMALTTIPAGFDETIANSLNGLDAACMAVPWLYFIGCNLSSGALLAKTRAVYGVSQLLIKQMLESNTPAGSHFDPLHLFLPFRHTSIQKLRRYTLLHLIL